MFVTLKVFEREKLQLLVSDPDIVGNGRATSLLECHFLHKNIMDALFAIAGGGVPISKSFPVVKKK